MATSRIGDVLLKNGRLTPAQLSQAIDAQERDGSLFIDAVVRLGFLSEGDLLREVSDYYGLPIVELQDTSIDDSALRLVPQALATKHGLVQKDHTLTLCVTDPSNMAALNDIKFITGLDVQLCLGKPSQVQHLQNKYYRNAPVYERLIDAIHEEQKAPSARETELQILDLERSSEDSPVVKLLNAVLIDAINKNASDIHFEPYEETYRVRFRIDGILYEIMRPPAKLKSSIVSRIKIIAKLDIAEKRLPQDGRFKLKVDRNKTIDFRVSITPTFFGEKAVLRILDTMSLQPDMTKLGFDPKQFELFNTAIAEPHGMILVTGPTGSGKTTTLYSAIANLNRPGTNICTVEDPIEINLTGVNQSQVNDEIGFTFAASLRSFLRQDPDVIMVGEIRDHETAEIAIKASMTGHLVLSTLHTNDAPATVSRLLAMGVEPFLVSSSINLIVAQRLARRACTDCAKEVAASAELIHSLGVTNQPDSFNKIKKACGCPRCANTGYRDRIALYEVLPIDDTLRELIVRGAPTLEIRAAGISAGMRTLRDSGIDLIRRGITTPEEVLRVTKNS